jgi:hypothetical protein
VTYILSFMSFIILFLHSISYFLIWHKERVQIHFFFFACGYPVLLAPFFKELSDLLWSYIGSILKSQLTTSIRVYFLILNSIILIYMSILMPVPHHLYYCSFILTFFFFLLHSFYNCFVYSGLLAFSCEF